MNRSQVLNNQSNPAERSNSMKMNKTLSIVEQELILSTTEDGGRDVDEEDKEEGGGEDLLLKRGETTATSSTSLNDLLIANEMQRNQEEKDQQQQEDYGFTTEELKSLPLECQLLLIQEKILKMIPPCKSQQQKNKFQIPSKSATVNKQNDVDQDDKESSILKKRSYEYMTNEEDNTIKRYYVDESSNNNASSSSSSSIKANPDGTAGAGDGGSAGEITISLLDPNLFITIVTHHQLKENFCLFQSHRPHSIILYDSEVYIIRRIETYQSMISSHQLQLYFFNYQGSTEEHRYVGSLNKEKKSFESLIQCKEHLVIALPDNLIDLHREKQADLIHSSNDSRMINSYQRQQSLKLLNRKIIVDVREFRSSLPFLLYSQSFQLLPRTLVIGDYILSPEIAIERKGITDLFQSFNSGRLYNQIEQMSKYYKFPILLIEFSPEKSFCFMVST
jgi:hypothetical protein